MEFVWRRLEEPAEIFGQPLSFEPRWWVGIALPLVLVALVLVARNCLRESKAIGKGWAALLGTLRGLVCLLLFFLWLLPAMRQVETTTQTSQVLLLFDVSASMQGSDAPPADLPDQPRPTRTELLVDLLAPPAASTGAAAAPPSLIGDLLKRNPLICFRFGEVLDPQAWAITAEQRLGRAGWHRRLEPRFGPPLSDLVSADLAGLLQKVARQVPAEQAADDAKVRAAAENFDRALADQLSLRDRLLNRTNLATALREALRKESGGNLQGIVLFSDGRANAGSEQELAEAVALARKEKVPIFTVGLGRDQRAANLRLVDLLAPGRIQPEDEFPVRVAVEGQDLPTAVEGTVVLQVERPNGTRDELKAPVTLAGGTAVSRAAAEFRLANPEKLKGDWKLTAKMLPLTGERTRADNALAEPVIVKVEEKKLSVLLIASGPLHDYQFLRALLAREPDKFDVSLWLQSAQPGTVQDVDPKRLLQKFPTDLRDRDADPNNLGNYDVIVAFDPDWRQVPAGGSPENPSPQANLRTWVEQLGGGLVLVAGPVHSFSLARDPGLQTIRYLYPVLLDDTAGSILQIDRHAKEPFALNWDPAATGVPFLDLLDLNDPAKALEGWEIYFDVLRNPSTGLAEAPAQRGFFSFFPLQDAKPGAQVLARYGDPDPKVMTPGGQRQPFFVLGKVGKGPVFFIGSPETYRLRYFSEKFHERFWTKMLRTLGKRESARGMLVVGSRYAEGDTVTVDVDLLDANLKPLSRAEFLTDLRLEARAVDASGAKPLVVFDEGLMNLVRRARAANNTATGKVGLSPAEIADEVRRLKQQPGFAAEPAVVGTPGKFRFRFPAGLAGKYRVDLAVPGSGEPLSGRFEVVAADPERDEPRPNHRLLHQIASPAREIQLLDASKRPKFLLALEQTRRAMEEESAPALARKPSLAPAADERLYFDLTTAPWIAECLDANPITYRTEGKTSDLWDKGITVFAHLDNPDVARGPSWALLLIIVLLGSEWLLRKLLRLA